MRVCVIKQGNHSQVLHRANINALIKTYFIAQEDLFLIIKYAKILKINSILKLRLAITIKTLKINHNILIAQILQCKLTSNILEN